MGNKSICNEGQIFSSSSAVSCLTLPTETVEMLLFKKWYHLGSTNLWSCYPLITSPNNTGREASAMKTVESFCERHLVPCIPGTGALLLSHPQDRRVSSSRAFMCKVDKSVCKCGYGTHFLARFLLYSEGFLSSMPNHFW